MGQRRRKRKLPKGHRQPYQLVGRLYKMYLKKYEERLPKEYTSTEDTTIVTEYKPVSAGLIQRGGGKYSSMIVSPFEPRNAKASPKENTNALIIESEFEATPKQDFSFLSWIKTLEDSFGVSEFIDADGDEEIRSIMNQGSFRFKDGNTYKWGFAIPFLDNDRDGIPNVIEEMLHRDGLQYNNVFEFLEDYLNVEGMTRQAADNQLNTINSHLYLGLYNVAAEEEEENWLPNFINFDNDSFPSINFIFRDGKQILKDFYEPVFYFKGNLNNLSRNNLVDTASGYIPYVGYLQQYRLSLDCIFNLKHKSFYAREEASVLNRILEVENNKEYKEKILTMGSQEETFETKRYYIRKEEADSLYNIERTFERNGFYEEDIRVQDITEETKHLELPIIKEDKLSSFEVLNNFVIANNYLSEKVFKQNPINMTDSHEIIFNQQELVHAKPIRIKDDGNWDDSPVEGVESPSIFSEDRVAGNSFKSILKKYLIHEIEATNEIVLDSAKGNHLNTIKTVLIPAFLKKLEPLYTNGVLFKFKQIALKKVTGDFIKNEIPNIDYLTNYFYLIDEISDGWILTNLPSREHYYGDYDTDYIDYFAINNKLSKNYVRHAIYRMLYNSIVDFLVQHVLFNFNEEFISENSSLFEEFLNREDIDALLPDISIVYSADDIDMLTSDPISTDVVEELKWSSVVDFIRNDNIKSKDTVSGNVIKLKDFLNNLNSKIETKINEDDKKELKILKSLGMNSVDFVEDLWKVKDQYGTIINDYYNNCIKLILINKGIRNNKTLSKVDSKAKTIKFLKPAKEHQGLEELKKGFKLIKNSIKSTIEIFNRFYNPDYFIDKSWVDANFNDEKESLLEKTKIAVDELCGKMALVKVKGKIGIIFNFDPLICYKGSLYDDREAGQDGRSLPLNMNLGESDFVYPFIYPYSSDVTWEAEQQKIPNVLAFKNLYYRDHVSAVQYATDSKKIHSGYNFKNMPAISAGIYSYYSMVGPDNPGTRVVIDTFYLVNGHTSLEGFSPLIDMTSIFYEMHHIENREEIRLKQLTGSPEAAITAEVFDIEKLKNRARLTLGIPVFILSDKVSEGSDFEYFTNKELIVDIDSIESIYFFDEKDYNPHVKEKKKSKKNTRYTIKAKK